MRAAEAGHRVIGYDIDPIRVGRLARGDSYIEDIPAGRLLPIVENGSYRPTTDLADLAAFDVGLITVPTPLRDGVPDLSYIEAAGETLAAHLRPGATVVLESTTYPGTTEEVLAPLLEKGSG